MKSLNRWLDTEKESTASGDGTHTNVKRHPHKWMQENRVIEIQGTVGWYRFLVSDRWRRGDPAESSLCHCRYRADSLSKTVGKTPAVFDAIFLGLCPANSPSAWRSWKAYSITMRPASVAYPFPQKSGRKWKPISYWFSLCGLNPQQPINSLESKSKIGQYCTWYLSSFAISVSKRH